MASVNDDNWMSMCGSIFNLHGSSVRRDNVPGTARGSLCPHDQEPPPAAPGTGRPAPTRPSEPKERRSPAA